jgi:hypothetical protein
MQPTSRRLRLIPLALLGAVAALAVAVPSALGGAGPVRAHAASSYLTGLGDEQTTMFSNPLYKQLHTKIARYIAPYDAAARGDELAKAREWIGDAEALHEQVLVAFYHSEHTPTKTSAAPLPSVATYQKDVAAFIRDFPHVRQYQAWDESNRGNIPHVLDSPSAATTARYYQALLRACRGCTVVGLDVLDAANITPTLRYISEFKREIGRLRTVMPKIWGLHNYSDVNRFQGWRTRELIRALGGQVWLTESGGIVQFGSGFPNRHGSGLTRAARALKFMFTLAGEHSQIKRLYIYDWSGGVASTRFDAGLTNAKDQPRAGYVVVCRQLHGADCAVKVASD